MWYESQCQKDNSLSKLKFIKDHYRSRYGLQHGTLAHTEQPAIKVPNNYKCKTIQKEKPMPINGA